MLTDKAKRKLKVIAFWQKHGLQAAIDAFGVKERTLYNWKRALTQGGGCAESLNEKPKRPKRVREWEWPRVVMDEIRRLRKEHPNLAKEKVHFFLEPFCKSIPSPVHPSPPSATSYGTWAGSEPYHRKCATPKCPKMNPHAERFNRTIQEEYINYHESKLANPETFNPGLMKHLLWHNIERPHFGINLQTPVNFITSNGYPRENCNMYLTNTLA